MDNGKLYWEYTTASVFRFSLPTVFVVVFMSLYQAVDGFFLANYVNSDAIAAVNIAYPLIGFLYALSLMFASGSTTMIAALLGKNQKAEANKYFTLTLAATFALSLFIIIILLWFLDECLWFLGASAVLKPYVSQYLFIMILVTPFILLQNIFLFFFIAIGKPAIGMYIVFASGGANIVLDFFFIKIMEWGITGAAIATATGYILTTVCSLIYFLANKKTPLHFCKCKFNLGRFITICKNGFSEMVTNLATSITTLLLNYAALQFFSEDGVAAVAIILYIDFFVSALLIGYTSGILPLISYNFGSKNNAAIKKIFTISLKIVFLLAAIPCLICIIFAKEITLMFIPETDFVFTLATQGILIWACAFPFMGMNIFSATLFTGFADGRTAAIIAFMRTCCFFILFLLVLPKYLQMQGVWSALPSAEICGFFITLFYFITLRKKYGFM